MTSTRAASRPINDPKTTKNVRLGNHKYNSQDKKHRDQRPQRDRPPSSLASHGSLLDGRLSHTRLCDNEERDRKPQHNGHTNRGGHRLIVDGADQHAPEKPEQTYPAVNNPYAEARRVTGNIGAPAAGTVDSCTPIVIRNEREIGKRAPTSAT